MVRFTLRWWLPFTLPIAAAMAVTSLGSWREVVWPHQTLAFVAIVILASLCAIGSACVLALGLRRRLPEVALLGSALWTVSFLPLVHGLLLPGNLYGDNPGTMVSVMAAVPAGLLAALPLLLDGTSAGRWLAAYWRGWALTWLALPTVAGVALLVSPSAIAAPAAGGPLTVLIVTVSIAGTTVLSLRHLRLFAIGRRAGSLLASLGFIATGLATIAFLGAAPMSPGWWLAHATDIAGVLFAAGGLLSAHWRDRSLSFALAPVLTREPLAALELGLTPVVHRFVAALELKDAVTREHVVRVGELAMRAAERAGTDALTLRAVGLGGLLHDIGKLLTPSEILSKPGKLTDEERSVIERHTIDGERMLAPYPHLFGVAEIVRSHHERPDGSGYPDRLTGDQIPLAASIVSVVDAWDAMISDRPYRDGMPRERAEAILREGAGTQWLPDAVEVVLAEIHERGPVEVPAFGAVGRADRESAGPPSDELVDACLPDCAGIARAA